MPGKLIVLFACPNITYKLDLIQYTSHTLPVNKQATRCTLYIQAVPCTLICKLYFVQRCIYTSYLWSNSQVVIGMLLWKIKDNLALECARCMNFARCGANLEGLHTNVQPWPCTLTWKTFSCIRVQIVLCTLKILSTGTILHGVTGEWPGFGCFIIRYLHVQLLTYLV